jgi:hypothetical protein
MLDSLTKWVQHFFTFWWKWMKISVSLHVFQYLLFSVCVFAFVFIMTMLVGRNWYISLQSVFICFYIMLLMLNIFSCVYCPFIYLLWRNFYFDTFVYHKVEYAFLPLSYHVCFDLNEKLSSSATLAMCAYCSLTMCGQWLHYWTFIDEKNFSDCRTVYWAALA